ncbi:MAG TPA: hypothetical protein VNV15_04335 [Opitutaceae bacterium]|nr:hypothetical protein [Opitutaceae bacterium]
MLHPLPITGTGQNDQPSSPAAGSGADESDPHIYYIGSQSILTFDKQGTPGAGTLNIPVYGSHLFSTIHNKNNTDQPQITLQITGTVPISEDDYDWDRSTDLTAQTEDEQLIKILPSYVSRLHTGDRLEVEVGIGRSSQAYYMRRTFTMYAVDDYRKLLAGRVPIGDINAFPLPDEETRYLFGPTITSEYYVVELTLRNSGSQDELVNIGMISADGSAIVQPDGTDKTLKQTYTVPIEIPPQSPLQVYAVLDGQGDKQSRSWIFRSLEFVGALGTAVVTSYTHTPADVVKGFTLFTGVGIPAGDKLWPDQWPRYKSNLVNFSMPELVKVPKQSTTTPKFIFFSKKNLGLLISDPTLFRNGSWFGHQSLGPINEATSPSVRVVTLAFDNLDIPFEIITSPAVVDLHETLNLLQSDLASHLARLQTTQKLWSAGAQFADGVDFATLKAISQKLSALPGRDPLKAVPETDDLKQSVTQLSVLAAYLAQAGNPKSPLFTSLLTDKNQPVASLSDLLPLLSEVSLLQFRLSAGADVGPLQERATAIQKQVDASRALFEFLMQAATIFASPDFTKTLDNWPTKAADLNSSSAHDMMVTDFTILRRERTFQALQNFAPDDYKKIVAP